MSIEWIRTRRGAIIVERLVAYAAKGKAWQVCCSGFARERCRPRLLGSKERNWLLREPGCVARDIGVSTQKRGVLSSREKKLEMENDNVALLLSSR